jgi:hypothetical protein
MCFNGLIVFDVSKSHDEIQGTSDNYRRGLYLVLRAGGIKKEQLDRDEQSGPVLVQRCGSRSTTPLFASHPSGNVGAVL